MIIKCVVIGYIRQSPTVWNVKVKCEDHDNVIKIAKEGVKQFGAEGELIIFDEEDFWFDSVAPSGSWHGFPTFELINDKVVNLNRGIKCVVVFDDSNDFGPRYELFPVIVRFEPERQIHDTKYLQVALDHVQSFGKKAVAVFIELDDIFRSSNWIELFNWDEVAIVEC